ncbi:hypothetical protein DY000_02048867 [Brassica cretica]|uniref:Uncharacterized protein n=1 Tax=Brassica cretica TaxID=69181 RepID=A0ABQ7EYU1_BRACR|nr:hypothetical protein DY000_02048867 [Brassica cretica]
MRTCSKTSLSVCCSLKFYHSCVKASSIDSSPLSIISAIRNARSFANGCEKHLLRTLDLLTPSEKFPHTSNSLCSDTRPVSIDGVVVASIDVGLLMAFDGIRLVSIDAAYD